MLAVTNRTSRIPPMEGRQKKETKILKTLNQWQFLHHWMGNSFTNTSPGNVTSPLQIVRATNLSDWGNARKCGTLGAVLVWCFFWVFFWVFFSVCFGFSCVLLASFVFSLHFETFSWSQHPTEAGKTKRNTPQKNPRIQKISSPSIGTSEHAGPYKVHVPLITSLKRVWWKTLSPSFWGHWPPKPGGWRLGFFLIHKFWPTTGGGKKLSFLVKSSTIWSKFPY